MASLHSSLLSNNGMVDTSVAAKRIYTIWRDTWFALIGAAPLEHRPYNIQIRAATWRVFPSDWGGGHRSRIKEPPFVSHLSSGVDCYHAIHYYALFLSIIYHPVQQWRFWTTFCNSIPIHRPQRVPFTGRIESHHPGNPRRIMNTYCIVCSGNQIITIHSVW